MTASSKSKLMLKAQILNFSLPLVALTFIAASILSQINPSFSAYEQPSEQPAASKSHHTCPKSWIHLNQKCFKIVNNSRNYEKAKERCRDLSAKLAVVEDDSSAPLEKESSNGASGNIYSYLTSPERNLQTRQYYVNVSTELLAQHQKAGLNGDGLGTDAYDAHTDSEVSISDLWLPRNDPSLESIIYLTNTTNHKEQNNSQVAFVLAYSQYHKRWGLVPVSPTRKSAFICELPLERPSNQPPSGTPSSNAYLEPKRASDANTHSQPTSSSGSSSDFFASGSSQNQGRALDSRRVVEKEANTTPSQDTSNMLFRETPQDHSIVLGSTAEMRCSALDSESTLIWTFNGKNLTTSNRVRSYANGTLRIEHVRNTDDGNYTCTIQNGGSSESKSARLEIIERPHQPEYITAELLDKLSTSVRIKWTPGFNGNSPIKKYLVEMRTVDSDNIENQMNMLMQSNQWEVAKANISADQTSVIIADLKPAKKYIFRIRATNRVGTGDPSLPTKDPIEVPVQPPSMAPENLIGVPKSSTSISIQWAPPPVDSHNGVLKGYKIRHKLAGYASDSDWYTNDVNDAAHLTFVLDDLIVWQNYEIQVAAENDKGVGPFSSSVLVRTKEGRPDKGPRNVAAEAVGSTSVRVTWNPPPPQHINGINQGYRVQIWYDFGRSQLAKELAVPHNTASPFHTAVVDGLLPYTEYYVSVLCYTNAGDGPANENDVITKTKQDLPEAVPVLEFADVLDKSLKVLWKPPRRVNGELESYTLEYSESASMTDKKIIKKYPAGTTEARILDLYPQTSYSFKIYPHTNVGQGPGKVNHTITSVPPVLPEPPTNLIYTNVGPYSVVIQFNPGFDGNASIEKWVAEALTPTRGEHAPRWQTIYSSTNHTQGSSVVVRNLRPFTRYRLRLTPVNIVGPSRSPSDPTAEFQTAQVEPEQPPRDLSVEKIKSNSLEVHWSPLANNLWQGVPRGYNLTWSDTNNSTLAYYIISDTRASSCIVRDLEEFTEYSFRIYSVNDAGLSPPSEAVVVTTLEDVPSSSPTNLTAHAISSNAISIDWSPIPRKHRNGIIRGYKIQYQALNSRIQNKTVEDNNTRHITLNDLKAFTTYQIAVAGFTSIGEGVYSTVLTAQTLEDTPGTPQNLSIPTVSQTTARILWDPPEDPNGEILGYKVSYHALTEGSKEVASHELHQNDRTFKATNLKPDTHYVFTVTAKTKEGWGQQASLLLYTYDSELRANLPFFRESWFVILCACLSIVITILITALLYVQTKSHKYKQDAIKSTSQDRLGDAGFSIDDEPGNHYNNGFSLLSHNGHHRRSNGALSQNTANFTLPKSPPRPHPGSVVYSDDGDDDVFEEAATKPVKSIAGTSNYDSSGDSLTEKPSEISSSTPPESESPDDEYVNMADKHFVNHYANVNGTLRGKKAWQKSAKHYTSHRVKPKLPQRPVPSVPQVPGDPSSSGSDNAMGKPIAGTSGSQSMRPSTNSLYGDPSSVYTKNSPQHEPAPRSNAVAQLNGTNEAAGSSNSQNTTNSDTSNNQNTQQVDLLNTAHMINLNGGRIIVDNMAGSRAPLPGFTSFV